MSTRRLSLPTLKIGWKEIRDTIFNVGYTLEGRFDPEHLDFQGFCCCCHVHTLARVLATLNLIMGIVSLALLIFDFLNDIKNILTILNLALYTITSPVVAIAVFWGKYYKWILPYLVYLFFYQLYLIGMMVYCSIKVMKPDDRNILPKEMILTEQLTFLIYLVFYSIYFLMQSLLFFTLYMEYCYLKGYNKYKKSQANI